MHHRDTLSIIHPLGLAPKGLSLMYDMLNMIHSSSSKWRLWPTHLIYLFATGPYSQDQACMHTQLALEYSFKAEQLVAGFGEVSYLPLSPYRCVLERIYLKWCSDYINGWIISTGRLNVSHYLIGLERRYSAIPSMVLWACSLLQGGGGACNCWSKHLYKHLLVYTQAVLKENPNTPRFSVWHCTRIGAHWCAS